MALLTTCNNCEKSTVEQANKVCKVTKAKIRTFAYTGCGTSFNNCLTDSLRLWDLCSTETAFPATYPNGTTHPNAGNDNVNRNKLSIMQQVSGDIYVPGDTEETELDYSCGPSKFYGDTDFTITVTRLYQHEDQAVYEKLDAGNFGEIAVVDEDGLGYIITDASVKVSRATDGDVQVAQIEISWKRTSPWIPSLRVAAPLYAACA